MSAEPVRSGEISSEVVPALLYRLYAESGTGSLLLEQPPVTKTLRLQRGAVVFAESGDRDDRLFQLLLKRGSASLPDLIKALEVSLKGKQRLGEVLLAQRRISQEELERALQDQLKAIVCSVFGWMSGSWRFEKGPVPQESVILKTHPLALILEGVRRLESWANVFEVVGGLNAEYRATQEARSLAEKANLVPGEIQVLKFCEETRSLGEICDAVSLNDFVVCKVVWGLLVIGALMKA